MTALPIRLFLVVTALAALSAVPALAGDVGLVKDLVGGLGVTPQQAAGGAKAIFDLAKTNLGADDYQKLARAVPDVAGLMGGSSGAAQPAASAAPAPTGAGGAPVSAEPAPSAAKAEGATPPAGAEAKQTATKTESSTDKATTTLLAAAAGAGLGDLGKLTANAGLVSKFAELGLKPEMIAKFAPVLFKNALASGGPSAGQLLKRGLGL